MVLLSGQIVYVQKRSASHYNGRARYVLRIAKHISIFTPSNPGPLDPPASSRAPALSRGDRAVSKNGRGTKLQQHRVFASAGVNVHRKEPHRKSIQTGLQGRFGVRETHSVWTIAIIWLAGSTVPPKAGSHPANEEPETSEKTSSTRRTKRFRSDRSAEMWYTKKRAQK